MPVPRVETCCVSGSVVLPYHDQEIRRRIRELAAKLVAAGVVYFLVGGDIGFDMIAAGTLLTMRRNDGLPIQVISVLPFPGYSDHWMEEYRLRQKHIMLHSDRVLYVSREKRPFIRAERDRKMADRAEYCLTYCTGPGGEEAELIRYALDRGLLVLNTDPWDLKQLQPDSGGCGSGNGIQNNGTEECNGHGGRKPDQHG